MSEDSIQVLVVVDDIDCSVALGHFLTSSRDFHYYPTLCHSGKQALELCRHERFDCVLTDYLLNDMTGAQVIEELRQNLDERMPPVIIMSSDGMENAAIESLRARATDFLLKDNVNERSVRRAVRNAVRQGQLNRGIQERRRELVMANLELERRANEIQRFYHTVSHEMKTPLTAAREFVSIVVDGVLGPVNEKQLDVLRDALVCCDQITTQFNDLIDLTRLETGKLSLSIKPSSLEVLLKRAIAIGADSAARKDIALEYVSIGDLPLVNMDEGRISQVVNNLVNNATKFTQSGGKIRVSARQKLSGLVQIRVTDTGPGIPKAYQTDIFDRLFQIDRHDTEESKTGLGLGLSVAREIIDGHGNELRVSSRLGVGSSFHFLLAPAHDSAGTKHRLPL